MEMRLGAKGRPEEGDLRMYLALPVPSSCCCSSGNPKRGTLVLGEESTKSRLVGRRCGEGGG